MTADTDPAAIDAMLRCECCETTAPAGTPGWCVTADPCDLCPGCASDLWDEWDAMSDEEREKYAY